MILRRWRPRSPGAPSRKPPAAEAILAYHHLSSHTYASVRRGDRSLDWDNEPSVFKSYPGARRIPFPKDLPTPACSLWDALGPAPSSGKGRLAGSAGGEGGQRDGAPETAARRPRLSLAHLAALSEGSYGITTVRHYSGGSYSLRAAPSAGALFPIEVYWVTGEAEGVPAGLYHHAVRDRAFEVLREGDWRGHVASAIGDPSLRASPAIALLTAIFWRSAWKYEERAYRYCLLDAGHLSENLRLLGVALGCRPVLRAHFVDSALNALIGLDGEREAALALVALEEDPGTPGEETGAAPPITLANAAPGPLSVEAPPCSPAEEVDPRILEVHRATSLTLPLPSIGDSQRSTETSWEIEEIPLVSSPLPPAPLAEVLSRRRSSHDFRRDPIALADLSAILQAAFQPILSDFSPPFSPGAAHPGEPRPRSGRARWTAAGPFLTECHLIVSAVDDLPNGHHRHSPGAERPLLVAPGHLRGRAEYISLEQALAGNASAVLFLIADLKGIAEVGWPRGYRGAHLEAGLIGQRVYLAATALGLGATGVGAFYDQEARDFLGVGGEGKAVLYELAFGRPRG